MSELTPEQFFYHHEPQPVKVPAGPTVMVDVDDTLLMWDLPEGVMLNDERLIDVGCRGYTERLMPNKHNIDLLKKLAARGHAIIVWSGGGADWAEAAVNALGLGKYVTVIMGKPTYYIDDIFNPKEWMGKHGYFTLDGERIHGDNLPRTKEDK
jgi:hydroxymethylpyrimidine pyrophosphatase-like HAD family hydrolase